MTTSNNTQNTVTTTQINSSIKSALNGQGKLTTVLTTALSSLAGKKVLNESLLSTLNKQRKIVAKDYGFKSYDDMISAKNFDDNEKIQKDFTGKSAGQIKASLKSLSVGSKDQLPEFSLIKAMLNKDTFSRGFKFDKKEQKFSFDKKVKKAPVTKDDAKLKAEIFNLLEKMSKEGKDDLIKSLIQNSAAAKESNEKLVQTSKAQKTRFINKAIKTAKEAGESTIEARENAEKSWLASQAKKESKVEIKAATKH